jgi:hypothetical protein
VVTRVNNKLIEKFKLDDDAAADHADNEDADFNVLGSVLRWYLVQIPLY